MILVDSSVWIDRFRRSDRTLNGKTANREILMHPFVMADVLLGSLRDRKRTGDSVENIEAVPVAAHADVHAKLEEWRAFGRGIGWVDLHLLASAQIPAFFLWTRGRRLGALADEIGLRFAEPG